MLGKGSEWKILMVAAAISVSGCGKKENRGISYQEDSHEATLEVTAEVFAGPRGEVGVEPAIEDFFTRMGEASRSSSPPAGSEFLSTDAMLETVEASGALDDLSASQKRAFRKGFEQGSAKFDLTRQLAFDRHRIARVETPASNRRVVYINLYDNELNVSVPMRFWLVRTEDGLRVHDFEDLSVGLRTVTLMTTMMKAGLAGKKEPWLDDFLPLTQSMNQLDAGDPEAIAGLRDPLLRLKSHDLPADVRRFASTMLVSAHLAANETEAAEEELNASRDGGYHGPLAHYQMGHLRMSRGQYREALAEFGKHAELMGHDSDILESISDCHLELGEVEAAREAALQGITDNPDAINCLASLAAASGEEQLAEPATLAHFDACDDPEGAYEVSLDYLLEVERVGQAKALFAACRDKFADPELVAYYEEVFAEMDEE